MEKLTDTFLVTGIAGSGKTRLFQDRIKSDPRFGVLCATTGVAAMNLGARTIHSFMGFSDDAEMRRIVNNGGFGTKLRKRFENGDVWAGAFVVIDEKSMLSAEQLDVIFRAFEDFNYWLGCTPGFYDYDGDWVDIQDSRPIGLALVGDFCQLAPIKAKFAFHAECWPFFEQNRINLTGSYRQSSGSFVEALNFARKGSGQDCTSLLKELKVEFTGMSDMNFNGTTIFGTKDDVDHYNLFRYNGLDAEEKEMHAVRWGQQKDDWRSKTLIPDILKLKIGARVMVTANAPRTFSYCNGDMGVVHAFSSDCINGEIAYVSVLLDRKDRDGKQVLVDVYRCDREWIDPAYKGPAWRAKQDGKVIGTVSYMPLSLAYALTVHKCQGLSLDKIQFNIFHNFTGGPAMCYVALSRCRTPEGVRVVGSAPLLASRIKVHPEVGKWL